MRMFRRTGSYMMAMFVAAIACRHQPKSIPVDHAAVAASAALEPRRFVHTQTPVASGRVARGELTGIVLESESGQPIANANVAIITAAAAGRTDSIGRFRLARIPRGSHIVHVVLTGYVTVQMPINVNPDSGYVTVVALSRSEPIGCRMFAGGYVPQSGVVVAARDALTGIGVSVPITIIATDGAFRDSVVVNADSLGRTHRTIAPDRPGSYHVFVGAPGYRDWWASARTRPRPNCGNDFFPAVFHAWLVPL